MVRTCAVTKNRPEMLGFVGPEGCCHRLFLSSHDMMTSSKQAKSMKLTSYIRLDILNTRYIHFDQARVDLAEKIYSDIRYSAPPGEPAARASVLRAFDPTLAPCLICH